MADAAGLILAQDLTVGADVPAGAMALRSGYAVAARDLVGVSAYAPLLVPIPPWTEAGQALPPGLDAIIPADGVSVLGSTAEIVASPSPGENVRRAGEDARSGECLRRRGEPVRARDVAAAIASGITSALVHTFTIQGYADPSTEVLSPVLSGLCGATVRTAPWSGEAPPPDAVGSSLTIVASHDRAAFDLLGGTGATVASGLALGSAEYVAVGLLGGTPLIVAPPRLDTLVALSYALIHPLIDRAAGRDRVPVWRRAALCRKLSSAVGLTELALVRDMDGQFEPLSVGSLTPSTLVRADGYVIIPPESEGFQAGAMVEVYGL